MRLGFLAFFALARMAAEATKECTAEQRGQRPGLTNLSVIVDDPNPRFANRWFMLYVPTYYQLGAPLPLWLLPPGAFNTPDTQMRQSEMIEYAEELQFAFVAMKAHDNLMNVFLKGQARNGPDDADDIAYTQAVLRLVRRTVCIDSRRIYCTGYSRGARFCSRLASELTSTFAAIAPVSGLRFPEPTNATRPMPIITFHGTDDPVNPYIGGEDPHANHEYWDDSVEVAVSKWVNFNGCKLLETFRQSDTIFVYRHTQCTENADVVFVKIIGGGHVWPGSRFPWSKGLRMVTHEINATTMIGAFFTKNSLPGEGGGVSALVLVVIGLAIGMCVAALVPRVLEYVRPGGDSESDSSEDDWEGKGS